MQKGVKEVVKQIVSTSTVMFQIKAAFWVTGNFKTGINLENFPGDLDLFGFVSKKQILKQDQTASKHGNMYRLCYFFNKNMFFELV